MTTRVCFRLQVRTEMLDEYRRRHQAVWPDMLRALAENGWHSYSLFLGEDGLLIGVFESDDPGRAMAAMDVEEVNARWQEHMAPLFAGDDGLTLLPEVFHLDDQLAALDGTA